MYFPLLASTRRLTPAAPSVPLRPAIAAVVAAAPPSLASSPFSPSPVFRRTFSTAAASGPAPRSLTGCLVPHHTSLVHIRQAAVLAVLRVPPLPPATLIIRYSSTLLAPTPWPGPRGRLRRLAHRSATSPTWTPTNLRRTGWPRRGIRGCGIRCGD